MQWVAQHTADVQLVNNMLPTRNTAEQAANKQNSMQMRAMKIELQVRARAHCVNTSTTQLATSKPVGEPRGRQVMATAADHGLICQQVLSTVSVHPKATDDDWALHHPQLLVASEDPQVAAGIGQAVNKCALQLYDS